MMVMMPLTFASNIFVDPATMPVWLRTFVEFNPVSQIATSVRHLANGVSVGPEVVHTLIWATLFGSLRFAHCGGLSARAITNLDK